MPDPFVFDEKRLTFEHSGRSGVSSMWYPMPDGSEMLVGAVACNPGQATWWLEHESWAAPIFKARIDDARARFYNEVGGENLSAHQKVQWFAKAAARPMTKKEDAA